MKMNGKRQLEFINKFNYVRVAGTKEEFKAANTIKEELKSFGVAGVIEEFQIEQYEILTATLEVIKPYKKEYTITGIGISGNTPAEGITAELFYAEGGEDTNFANIKGKILLLNKAPTGAIYKKMVEKGAIGFITISGTPFDTLDDTDLETRFLRSERHLKNGEIAKIPGATIRYNDALEILEGDANLVTLTVIQKEFNLPSHNVIAEIAGEIKDEVIVYTAHYDSVPFAVGAYDNLSGSAIIMEMCRYYFENKPKRTVRFIWCGSEERGLLGSKAYAKAHQEELKNIILNINVDLVGQMIGEHRMIVTAEKSLCGAIDFIAKEIGFAVLIKYGIYSSDSEVFADNGVPVISFLRTGTGGHCRRDTISLMSAKSLEASSNFICHLSNKLINSVSFPIKREIPEDIKEQLEVYFGRKEKTEEGWSW